MATPYELNLSDEGVEVAEPPGYVHESTGGGSSSKSKQSGSERSEDEAKEKRAMAFAQSPARNLLMSTFMLYMSGNTIQVFSIYTTFNAISTPLKALSSLQSSFSKFEGASTSLTLPKALYAVINLAGLAVGLYKLNAMGLLPTYASDWLSSLPPLQYREIVGGGEPLE
jgi:hypothetical protein